MNTPTKNQPYKIIGDSPEIQKIYHVVDKSANSDSTVMIFGESGTGKELIARALHHNSERRQQPFIAVNCGAIPHDLLESELFGYEKGAFTGAAQTRVGRLELAHEGTVFLDEIGDMPTPLQVKLLRVLSEREIDRIGGSKSIPIDVRVVAATNVNIESAIEQGKFREDLFYRLNIIPIHMPPLRERKTDIPLLVNHFLNHFNLLKNKSFASIEAEAMEILKHYNWPGNIRELQNFVERMVVLGSGTKLTRRDLPEKVLNDVPHEKWAPLEEAEHDETPAEMIRRSFQSASPFPVFSGIPEEGINLKQTVEDFEREIILEALEKTGWVKNKAATLLGLNRTTLVEKLKKMKISRDD
ncbi:MAG: sigma-54-dependent Fis family transcriptional regulator [Candidatus Nitrohelix vancouverensis]|uniref:Sigma-54-dependent Fis family transcriptional regulator n=1 Tax=Candidatus Nitrohelix vancouverensis TaxID=2705534 RepID=A0A7T0G2N9_9BACT|nr:MAG: sigma-54-dependent Fis family transcriptional regulator [Candidatus Nitrohelix vancouverensis]